MKQYILLISALLVSMSAWAQSKNAYTEALVNLSAKSKSVSAEDYVAFSEKHFKKKNVTVPHARYFQSGNMQIILQEKSTSAFEPFSFESKIDFYKGLENWTNSHSTKLLDTEVKKYGNSKYLIIHYRLLEEEHLAFFSELYNGDKYLYGDIICKPDEIPAARQFLQSVLPPL